jgi:hypothetical protein
MEENILLYKHTCPLPVIYELYPLVMKFFSAMVSPDELPKKDMFKNYKLYFSIFYDIFGAILFHLMEHPMQTLTLKCSLFGGWVGVFVRL